MNPVVGRNRFQISIPAIRERFDRRANVGLRHLALAIITWRRFDELCARVSDWPGVVLEFPPTISGKGPKIHFTAREPRGVGLWFAHYPRREDARKPCSTA